MKHQYRKIIGTAFLSVSAILIFVSILVTPKILLYIEQNISFDGTLDRNTKIAIWVFNGLAALGLGLIGLGFRGIIDFNKLFLRYRLFLFSSVVGIFWITLFNLRYVLNINHLYFTEDGLFENLTALNFFVSAIVLYLAMAGLKINAEKQKFVAKSLIAVIASSLFLFGLEEISWGQRIFGWGTPAIFSINVQNETNIHNLIPYEYFLSVYQYFNAILLSIFAISCLLSITKKHNNLTRILLPPCDFVVLVAIMLPLAHEIWEELFSVFCIFYAFRIFFEIRSGINRVKIY